MRRGLWLALVLGLAVVMPIRGAGARVAQPDALLLSPVGAFAYPTYVTSPPGDQHRLFVTEQAGVVRLVLDGAVQATPFLDVYDLVDFDFNERGFFSIAFPPDYATSGLFYVDYTANGIDDADGAMTVYEYQRSDGNPNVADESTRRRVISVPHPNQSNHNGGQLQFGKDGDLYASVGDGGTGGSTAPDTSVLNGKILRIDPHGVGDGAHSIPPTNPFAGSSTARQEIWGMGLRNPFRFSFDALTGDLLIGDVGEGTREEIDFSPASAGGGRGANYGWPDCEGFTGTCPGATPPVFDYPHTDPGGDVAHGCAIIGGYVYRGTQAPELAGRYLYADLCTSELRSIQLGIPLASGDRPESAPDALSSARSFGEDSACNLYVMNTSAVFRIVGSGGTGASACPATTPAACQKCLPGKKGKKCRKRKKKHRAAEAKKKHKHKKCKKPKTKHKKKN
jgi:glucose/arabinose dehydrogenase